MLSLVKMQSAQKTRCYASMFDVGKDSAKTAKDFVTDMIKDGYGSHKGNIDK